jgi:hypothetical protein
MSLILNGTSGLFGNVTGGDISGNFIGLNGNGSSLTATATGSTAARSLANRFADVVNVKDFLCIDGLPVAGDGIHDDTTGIQAAIDHAANNKTIVFFPSGIYCVSQIVIKNFVSLVGVREENGWARLLNYTKGSIIKSLNNSGLSPIILTPNATNWTIQNLIVDANKANQTNPGVHCLEYKRGVGGDSFGGLIDNCKFVNPTGWGAYLMRCRPIDIRDSFFMDGIAMIQCFDVNIQGCSIDGTSSKHPALLWDSCNSIQAVGNLIFRGESPSNQIKQTATVDIANDWITITDDSLFYDDQPVTLETTGSFPSMSANGFPSITVCGVQSFLVKKLGSNRIQLWRNNTNATTGYSVLFNTTGSGVLSLTSGAIDIFCSYEGFNQKIADNRIAGSPGGAFRSTRSDMVSYDNNDSYLLNWDNNSNEYAIILVGSKYNSILNSFCGDLDQEPTLQRLEGAIYVGDDISSSPNRVADGNIFANNQYNLTQGLFVKDISTAIYERRNKIVGLDDLWGGITSATNRVQSNTFRSEPLKYYYYAAATSAQTINSSTNTSINWTATTIGNPRGITNGSSILFPMTAGGLLKIDGSIGFTIVTGTYYFLVKVVVNTQEYRFYFENEINDSAPPVISVPFSLTVPTQTDATITIEVFQNSGNPITLRTNQDTTRLLVQKVADYQFV